MARTSSTWGDFIDDYATDRSLRNDLGLFFLVTFDHHRPVRVEAVPLALDYCHPPGRRGEAAWIAERFRRACGAFGTVVTEEAGRLTIDWSPAERSGDAGGST